MWDPDTPPTFGFAELAREVGVHRARMQFRFYEEQHQRRQVEAKAIENAMAQAAAKRGEYVWNEEIDGMPVARFAMSTYLNLYRASLPQKGCTGGEFLNDEDFMKFFLKRNEQCAIKVKSPNVTDGWTPALEQAAWEGKQKREAEAAAHAGLVTHN